MVGDATNDLIDGQSNVLANMGALALLHKRYGANKHKAAWGRHRGCINPRAHAEPGWLKSASKAPKRGDDTPQGSQS